MFHGFCWIRIRIICYESGFRIQLNFDTDWIQGNYRYGFDGYGSATLPPVNRFVVHLGPVPVLPDLQEPAPRPHRGFYHQEPRVLVLLLTISLGIGLLEPECSGTSDISWTAVKGKEPPPGTAYTNRKTIPPGIKITQRLWNCDNANCWLVWCWKTVHLSAEPASVVSLWTRTCNNKRQFS